MNEAEGNAEIVRRGHAAINAADMKAPPERFAETASSHTPRR